MNPFKMPYFTLLVKSFVFLVKNGRKKFSTRAVNEFKAGFFMAVGDKEQAVL